MADFLLFTEGANELMANGLPATCTFELSTRQIGAGGTPLTAATTHSGGYGLATGTGYTAKPKPNPPPSAGSAAFSVKTWATGSATDWPANVYTCILRNATSQQTDLRLAPPNRRRRPRHERRQHHRKLHPHPQPHLTPGPVTAGTFDPELNPKAWF